MSHASTLAAILVLALAGCPDDPPGTGGAGAGDTGAGGAGGSGAGGEGGEPPTFDCRTVPEGPLGQRVMVGPRGYHGLAIDAEGRIYGTAADLTLVRSTYDGAWMPFLPNVATEQIAFAPNGHLILAAADGLGGITPDAQRYAINPALYGYGLRVGPNGRGYLAEARALRSVNLVTGIAETLAIVEDDDPAVMAHALDFSPSFDALYVGMTGESGVNVRVLRLDDDLQPLGPLEDFAEISHGKVWIDGVATDICGNLYVADFTSSKLYRITPDGFSAVYFDWSDDPTQYGHGVVFGTGVGGFREDAIYLPMPYNDHTVQEIIVGVPSRAWAGVALGAD